MSALLQRRRLDIQTGTEPASTTYQGAPRQVAGLNAVSPTQETTADEPAEKHEHNGVVLCCVRANECLKLVQLLLPSFTLKQG